MLIIFGSVTSGDRQIHDGNKFHNAKLILFYANQAYYSKGKEHSLNKAIPSTTRLHSHQGETFSNKMTVNE